MKKLIISIILLLFISLASAQVEYSRLHIGIMAEDFSSSTIFNRMTSKSIILNYHLSREHAIGLEAGVTDAHLANPFTGHSEDHFNGKNVFHLNANYYRFFEHSNKIRFFYMLGPALIISGSKDYTKNYSQQSTKIPDDYQFTWGANAGVGLEYKLGRAISLIIDYNTSYKHQAVYYLSDRVADNQDQYTRIEQDVSAKITQSDFTSHVRIGLTLGF